ncbi:hypothetical protein IE53DRAFT_391036 [Violaceomyces palustris]|uniref:Uncharacterized protein n=1 Tax=Violaceomyces palustris TaxID=1673888 RepID=A0ACD0NLW6_9BASI|nr:hypothetical protein IE53DRAFT_391036 [Violaceomyces palustris]
MKVTDEGAGGVVEEANSIRPCAPFLDVYSKEEKLVEVKKKPSSSSSIQLLTRRYSTITEASDCTRGTPIDSDSESQEEDGRCLGGRRKRRGSIQSSQQKEPDDGMERDQDVGGNPMGKQERREVSAIVKGFKEDDLRCKLKTLLETYEKGIQFKGWDHSSSRGEQQGGCCSSCGAGDGKQVIRESKTNRNFLPTSTNIKARSMEVKPISSRALTSKRIKALEEFEERIQELEARVEEVYSDFEAERIDREDERYRLSHVEKEIEKLTKRRPVKVERRSEGKGKGSREKETIQHHERSQEYEGNEAKEENEADVRLSPKSLGPRKDPSFGLEGCEKSKESKEEKQNQEPEVDQSPVGREKEGVASYGSIGMDGKGEGPKKTWDQVQEEGWGHDQGRKKMYETEATVAKGRRIFETDESELVRSTNEGDDPFAHESGLVDGGGREFHFTSLRILGASSRMKTSSSFTSRQEDLPNKQRGGTRIRFEDLREDDQEGKGKRYLTRVGTDLEFDEDLSKTGQKRREGYQESHSKRYRAESIGGRADDPQDEREREIPSGWGRFRGNQGVVGGLMGRISKKNEEDRTHHPHPRSFRSHHHHHQPYQGKYKVHRNQWKYNNDHQHRNRYDGCSFEDQDPLH